MKRALLSITFGSGSEKCSKTAMRSVELAVGRRRRRREAPRRLPVDAANAKAGMSQPSRTATAPCEARPRERVDVRLASEFERMKVTSRSEQADFLSQVREALQPGS